MIPAPPGIEATYKHDTPGGPHWTARRVIAFDDDGRPLIVDLSSKRDKTRLVRADTYADYDGMRDTGGEPAAPAPFTQIIPAAGWRAEYTYADGSKWSQPLAAWGLRLNGDIEPLASDPDGLVEPADYPKGGGLRIYHPDADPLPDEPTEE